VEVEEGEGREERGGGLEVDWEKKGYFMQLGQTRAV